MNQVSRIIFVLLALSFSPGCGKSLKNSLASHPQKTDLLLSEAIASEGCLSVPRLYSGLRELSPGMQVTVVPTQLSFSSKNTLRPAFRNLVAYGALKIQSQPISQVQDLPAATQESCSKVVITRANGEEKTFTVKKAGPDSLEAEAEDGEGLEYTWLSPHRLKETRRYVAYDLPCQSEKVPVLVSISRVLDWGGSGLPASLPASGADLAIDKEFLSLAAEAVGADVNTLYVSGQDGVTAVDVAKVNNLSEMVPRQDLVSCGRAPSTPPEQPAEPGNSSPPDSTSPPDNSTPPAPAPAPEDGSSASGVAVNPRPGP